MCHFLRRLSFLVTCVAAASTAGSSAQAQEIRVGISDRAPRFYVNASPEPVALDASRSSVLRRRISVDFNGTKLGDAIEAISRQSGLRLMYSWTVIQVDRRVTLKAEGISVAGALSEILLDAGVDVLFERDGQAALVKRGSGPPRAAVGSIAGRVTDATTQQGIEGVRVSLEGTRWATTTDRTGSYRLSGVAPGAYTLVTRRLGYKALEQAVVVPPDRDVSRDVVLQPVPSALDQVVVTVTGDQRLRELGHVVGRINADSVVREAPISSVSELLTGRVAGLQVFQNSGTVGGQSNLRIRGNNSLILGPEPIIVVDGIRYSGANRPNAGTNPGQVPAPANVEASSPLNDISVSDIESIEIVKGPSAATLYGSDAANGVVVITTKRGRPGPPRWRAYARGSATGIPQPKLHDIRWGWPGVANGTRSCTLILVAAGSCTQDSVTAIPSALTNPQYTSLATKPSWEYGMNVSGGQSGIRYYFSGDFEDATGPIQMPPVVVEQLMNQRGLTELPREWREPNGLTTLSLRSNVTAIFSEAADLHLSTGYIRSNTRTLTTAGLDAYAGTGLNARAVPWGTGGLLFMRTSAEEVNRFLANATGRWRFTSWLDARATLGVDFTNFGRHSLAPRGDPQIVNGRVSEEGGRHSVATADIGTTATLRRGSTSWRTALGAQYVRGQTNSLFTLGDNIPPGVATVQQALTLQARHTNLWDATLGTYVEETFGLNDRLFLIGALRLDGSSTFGQDYSVALFPKFSASWLVSEEPFFPRVAALDELRLRYAFGASGRQPLPAWRLPAFFGSTAIVDGVVDRSIGSGGFGNRDLRPERVREYEFGFDAGVLNRRLTLGLTWFGRTAKDQIINFNRSSGLYSAYTNVGLTKQSGYEAELGARLIETAVATWDLKLLHNLQKTLLVDLGGAPGRFDLRGDFVEGYPLGARFGRGVTGYNDANGDGILVFDELVRDPEPVFMGVGLPPESQTLSSVVSLFGQRLRLAALAERRAGHTQINPFACRQLTCREAVDPAATLDEQAWALAQQFGGMPEKADYIRLRELSTALSLPEAVTRRARVSSASLVFAVRNVALWTDFSGPDPEAGRLAFDSELAALRGNVANGIPLARSYTFRLDVSF